MSIPWYSFFVAFGVELHGLTTSFEADLLRENAKRHRHLEGHGHGSRGAVRQTNSS